MLQAVIFDMDGVIVDSEPLHVEAERMLFAQWGVQITDEELHAYMGRTPQILLTELMAKYQITASFEDIFPIHKENLARLYRERVEAIPGTLDLIQQAREAGLALGLASSSDHVLIRIVLEILKLTDAFSAVVSGEDVGRVKPAPDIFLLCAERLGCSPATCVVIEDSAAGLRGAKAAGMVAVGFRSPSSPGQDLSTADLIIDDLCNLDVAVLTNLASDF